MDLSVIIVNYNTKELTRNCIESVISNSVGINHEIILIDNASKDGSCEYLREIFPSLKILSNNENLGFAKANNQGIRVANGQNILLLNSDTIVLDDCLLKCCNFIKSRNDIGIIGCKVLNPDYSLQYSCFRYPTILSELIFFTKDIIKSFWDPISSYKYMEFWNHNTVKEVETVTGCFMFIEKEVFEKVGYLDENFFMYYEDLEFCRRVHEKGGYKVVFYPTASIIHHRAMSSDKKSSEAVEQTYLSALRYMRICYGIIGYKIFRFLCTFFWSIEIVVFLPFSMHPNFTKKIIMLKQLCKLRGGIIDENA